MWWEGGGGLCPSRELALSPVIQSSYLSCFYVQATNLSFVFRKHLVPWEFLNLMCVCTFVRRGCICGVCSTCICVYCMGMFVYAYAFVCMCVFVSMYMCALTRLCVCTRVHIYSLCLMRKEVCSIAPGPGDNLISPRSSRPTCWAMEMAKPSQTWNTE